MKKKIVIAFAAVVWVCTVIFVIHHFLIGNWSSNNISRYIKLTEYKDALPEIEDFGQYYDVDFKYYRKNMLMFFSDAYTIKLSYDEENYQKEKTELLQRFVYETDKLTDYGGYEKDPDFELDTYHFKMVSSNYYDFQEYPHELLFVGLSDEKLQIAIVYFWDTDIDYIDTTFSDFLRSDCGWE